MKETIMKITRTLTIVVMATVALEEPRKVRLANDTFKRQGIVELLSEHGWKPICGSACWSHANAYVTCTELGFEGGRKHLEEKEVANCVSTDYQCIQNEQTLNSCPQNCVSAESGPCNIGAQVICQGAIQLNSYKSSGDRKVEVFRENVYRELKWRGLCSTCWTNHNTDVVCKQYGFMNGEFQAENESSSDTWENFAYACFGNETHLSECPVVEECKKCTTGNVIVKCYIGEYNDTCASQRNCKDGLVCVHEVCTCDNEINSYWNEEEKRCSKGSNFSAVFVPLTQTFQSAREFCIEKLGGNLALPEEVQHLFLECAMYDADIWLEHVSLYKEMDIEYDTTEKTRQCLYGTKSGGMLYTNGQVDCSETFSFLCVVNGSTYSNSTKCKKFNEFHEAVNTPVQSTDPLPMIIVGVSVFVILVIVLTGAVCLYKRRRRRRRRRENNKHGPRVLYDTRKENNSGVDKLNIDTDPENQYDSTSDVMETNHYGYGVLGGKRGENAGNDMYSQSGQLNNKDEYDTFIRKEEDTDVNDMYDHTRAVTHEDHYDEFQKQK